MKEDVYVVIMAGGRGERFWPVSTPSLPKPFLNLVHGKSLIELTFLRAKRIAPEEKIFFVVGEEHVKPLLEAVPGIRKDSIISEPEGRDTGACIGYSALLIDELNEDSVMVVFPADHYIKREEVFEKAVFRAIELARNGDYLVTFGITPTRPETGYGYIKVKDMISEDDVPVFRVERFVEKPSIDKAKEYIDSGDYYWNSGMFVWRTKVIIRELSEYLPELFQGLKECMGSYKTGNHQRFKDTYRGLQKISIDYGVMEKSSKVLMVKGDFIWDDVGTWSSLYRLMEKDEDLNVILGDPFVLDVKDSLILCDKVNLGVAGLSGIIVVATERGVLVCSKEYAQKVREIAKYFSSK